MSVDLLSTPLPGVFELTSHPFVDSRGIFLNLYRDQDHAFASAWGTSISQVNFSRTESVGAIRGLHLQAHPHSEVKLVRCLKGRVWDVAVDLRPSSLTYRMWHAIELTPERSNAIIIPKGFAHGFQVLESGSELLYFHSGNWVPDAEIGVRWDDPQLAITWPLAATEISSRDRSLPFLSELNSSYR